MRPMHMGPHHMGANCPYKAMSPMNMNMGMGAMPNGTATNYLDLSGMTANGNMNGMNGMMSPMMNPMMMNPMMMNQMAMSPMTMGMMGQMMGDFDVKKALELIKEAVRGEKEDELFYDWLISKAPTSEEKTIIASIRDDERKHNRMFKDIYKALTGETVTVDKDATFTPPASYLAGIEKALFGELAAFEKYRFIYLNLPYRVYRSMVFEIMTDEIKHASKYNYLYAKNK